MYNFDGVNAEKKAKGLIVVTVLIACAFFGLAGIRHLMDAGFFA